jgi:hypothetical protein
VFALCSHDDGGGRALYAGGAFSAAAGAVADNVARWDGVAWAPLGAGIPNGAVLALASFDDGGGADLYAAGIFSQAGGATANAIARWDGAAWSALPGNLSGSIDALVVHDDGSGSALYAGGSFTISGPGGAARVARWNGTAWSPVGVAPGPVDALCVYDDGLGGGPALYASGTFGGSGGVLTPRVARWDGSAWTSLDVGIDHGTTALAAPALAVHDDGAGAALFAGGLFTSAGGRVARSLARWTGDAGPGQPFCTGDGLDPAVTTPCPCNNPGGVGLGCRNATLAGARLSATGTTSPNTVELLCSNVAFSSDLCVFLKSTASQPAGVSFGQGVRCVDGALVRFAALDASGGFARAAAPDEAPGTTVSYQVWYRDGAIASCPGPLFNVSGGYRIVW